MAILLAARFHGVFWSNARSIHLRSHTHAGRLLSSILSHSRQQDPCNLCRQQILIVPLLVLVIDRPKDRRMPFHNVVVRKLTHGSTHLEVSHYSLVLIRQVRLADSTLRTTSRILHTWRSRGVLFQFLPAVQLRLSGLQIMHPQLTLRTRKICQMRVLEPKPHTPDEFPSRS